MTPILINHKHDALYLLDTDHITLLQYNNARLLARCNQEAETDVVVSIISYEEQFRGWLNTISQAKTPDRFTLAYLSLSEFERFYCKFRVLSFDIRAASIYETLRKTHRRSGKMDLRIAAIALAVNATLVTRNTQDFISIANLRLDNWI